MEHQAINKQNMSMTTRKLNTHMKHQLGGNRFPCAWITLRSTLETISQNISTGYERIRQYTPVCSSEAINNMLYINAKHLQGVDFRLPEMLLCFYQAGVLEAKLLEAIY